MGGSSAGLSDACCPTSAKVPYYWVDPVTGRRMPQRRFTDVYCFCSHHSTYTGHKVHEMVSQRRLRGGLRTVLPRVTSLLSDSRSECGFGVQVNLCCVSHKDSQPVVVLTKIARRLSKYSGLDLAVTRVVNAMKCTREHGNSSK